MSAVEGAHEHRRLREGLEDRLELARTEQRRPVDAEQQRLGFAGAGEAQQVDAGAVAIIDLHAEVARQLDLARLGVDQGQRDALGHHHLGDGLPNRP